MALICWFGRPAARLSGWPSWSGCSGYGDEKELLVGWIDGLGSAENEGDGRVGWIGRDPEENGVAAAGEGMDGWDSLGLGLGSLYKWLVILGSIRSLRS